MEIYINVFRLMTDPKVRLNKEEVVMSSYEGILYGLRRRERDM